MEKYTPTNEETRKAADSMDFGQKQFSERRERHLELKEEFEGKSTESLKSDSLFLLVQSSKTFLGWIDSAEEVRKRAEDAQRKRRAEFSDPKIADEIKLHADVDERHWNDMRDRLTSARADFRKAQRMLDEIARRGVIESGRDPDALPIWPGM